MFLFSFYIRFSFVEQLHTRQLPFSIYVKWNPPIDMQYPQTAAIMRFADTAADSRRNERTEQRTTKLYTEN